MPANWSVLLGRGDETRGLLLPYTRFAARDPSKSIVVSKAPTVIEASLVHSSNAMSLEQVLDIAQKTADLVELGQNIATDDVVLKTDYAYPVYGVPSDETNEAIRLCARLEGMMTDPVYEGKSAQGMIDLIRTGFFPSGSKILYAHLGGVPAINGYSYVHRNG